MGRLLLMSLIVLSGCEMQQRPDGSYVASLSPMLGGSTSAPAAQAGPPGQSDTSGGSVEDIVQRVSIRFKSDLENGGMSGVVDDVQRCYATDPLGYQRDCIALDGAAKYFDDEHVRSLAVRGSAVPNQSYLANAAWAARMQDVGRRVFGTDQRAMAFLGETEKPIAQAALR